MMENEAIAIEVLKKRICNEKPIQHFCNDSCMHGGNQCAISMAIKSLEAIDKIKDIIREEEHYEVSNSLENPHPNNADYNSIHADKFNRIWKVISDM